MNSDERFLSRVVSLGGLVDAAILVGMSFSWVGALGEWWWFFDLFSHFRLQYLGVSLFALAWFVGWANRAGIVLSGTTLLLNAVIFFGVFLGEKPLQPAPDFKLRALSINVKTSNRAFSKVIDYVKGADADVVLLLEVDKRWADALAPLKGLYPHSSFESREDNFGVAFLSRIALISSEIAMFAAPNEPDDIGIPAPIVVVNHGGKAIRVIGAHPIPPSGRLNSQWRDHEFSRIAKITRESDEPVLLMGDLNVTPWSSGMRILTGSSNLRLPLAHYARSPSWMVNSPLAIPIDHALATPPLVILRRDVGPDVGSDHRPIVVEVGWAE